jgi:hypothetical protein
MEVDMNELQALEAAKAASIRKSLELWERDGRIDRGICGAATMCLDKRSKLAKVALANGFASDSGYDVSVKHFLA